MTRLVLAFLVLTAAALLAAVGWVLLRPRGRWPERRDHEWCGPHEHVEPDPRRWERAQAASLKRAPYSGSPESVTSRADNGWDAPPNGTGLFV